MSLLPPLASISALEARLGLEEGALEGAELDRAMACLEDASIIVRHVSQRDWIELDDEGEPVLGDDGEPVVNAPQILVKITRDVARRMFTNPDAEVQEGDGPFLRRLKDDAVGSWLLEDERKICESFRPGNSGLYTISTYRDDYRSDDIWFADPYGTKHIPWFKRGDVFW